LCVMNLQNPGLLFERGSLPHTLTHIENLSRSRISCNILSRHLTRTQDPVNRWLHTVHVCYLPGLGAVRQKRIQPLFDFTLFGLKLIHSIQNKQKIKLWLHLYYMITCDQSRPVMSVMNLQNSALFFERGRLPHTLTHIEYLRRSRISCNIMSWHLAHTQDPVNRWLHTRHVC
jgi:hypothetical protein